MSLSVQLLKIIRRSEAFEVRLFNNDVRAVKCHLSFECGGEAVRFSVQGSSLPPAQVFELVLGLEEIYAIDEGWVPSEGTALTARLKLADSSEEPAEDTSPIL